MNDKIICSHCGGNMHKVWFKEKEYKDYGKMSEANWNRVIEEIERKIRKHTEEEYRKTLSYNGQKEKEGEIMSEAQEQIAVMRWAELQSNKYPELKLLFHIPNGSYKSKAQAGLFKAMGLKSGVPDLFLPVARQCYHGLFIEMKTNKGRPSKAQLEWFEALREQGYGAVACYGFENAIGTIKEYLCNR